MKYILSIAGVLVILVIFLFGVLVGNHAPSTSLGSIVSGQDYTSTTTNSTYANSQRSLKGGTTTLVGGTLGSIIVTTTSATVVEIMDATSTTDLGSTTLAKFGASPATGTYTFDSSFSRGLRVNFPGSFNGNYTITWR